MVQKIYDMRKQTQVIHWQEGNSDKTIPDNRLNTRRNLNIQ